jgi:anti-anti-sigma factor
MNCGNILYAMHEGRWVLRLSGDVRAVWCASLDELVDRMFAEPGLQAIFIDLREATNIDSTMLGLLARIAVRSREQLKCAPVLVGPNPDIRRLLDSMCFEKVFVIANDAAEAGCECAELPVVEKAESEVCRQIADAHRVLMDIDERNRATFRDVVASLESHQRAVGG